MAEIEPFPCSLLAQKYLSVPNLGDVEHITESDIQALGHIDAVLFGSPCQDLSIAGKRAGLKGERSGLFFTAMRIVRWSRARWTLFENVPGLFSSNSGADFASVVGEMVGLPVDIPNSGWKNSGVFVGPDAMCEWAVMDAQYFGVPQRRRRIFIIRDTGDWFSRPPVLFDAYSLQGHPAPRREAGKDVASTIGARPSGGGGLGTDFDLDGGLRVVSTLDSSFGRLRGCSGQDANHGHSHLVVQAFGGNNCKGPIDVATAVNACATASGRMDFESETFIAFNMRGREGGAMPEDADGLASLRAADGGSSRTYVVPCMAVRRLTPRECERLQGFPDDYTLVTHRGKPAADGPRYKALGNSWAVPVVRWIAERIKQVDSIPTEAA